MEVVISIVGKAAEYTVDPIARQVSYSFTHKSKFQNLKGQLQQLKDARETVQQTVNEANRKGDEIFSYVDRWLTEVNGKICEEAAAQLEEDEGKAKQRCFIGLCPNLKSRYQLSRKAEKEANIIAELLKEKDRFDRVSYRPPPEGIATRPVKEYVAFESRTGAFDAVMKALKDANLSIIGVYGMGGVGKTTLVKQVARQAREENLFDEVVMAVVTQNFDIKKIQDQIADELGLKFDKQSDPGRAGELRDRLKKNKKVLLILDDIWMKLDMEALGIPYVGEHRGCKILLTSRNLDVLNLMDSQENLAIEILKEEEAWELFKKMTTDIVLRPDLKSTAIEVAKKCAGLPIAIVTVGKAMKNKKKEFEWKNALQELRRPSKRNFKGIPGGVYSAIELSYNFLEVEECGPTFLLCSIMGHDAAIEDLLKYGMGLGLFHGVNTVEETRCKVSTLVSNLKTSSLLLDGSTSERFDMHDVVRDVALSIASRDHHWLALGRDDVFKDWSDEEKMRNYKLISLQYAKVSEFLNHDLLECPNLTFFSLGSENSSLKISNNFFKGMQSLKVLDFAKMHFSSLPSSFCFLKNIQTLCFSGCFLKDIAVIGELKNLKILSLRKSEIAVLPQEIGQLTELTLLDLSYCYSLKVISPNVLSRLAKLEELCLYDGFDRWEVEGHEIFEKPRANASLVELQHLSHLKSLELHIPNEQAVPKELFSEKLERYKISIGEKWRWNDVLETSRNLKLKLNKRIHLYDTGVKTLLRKTETLYLDAVKDVMNILYDPNTEGLSHLKHFRVSNNSEAIYIINSMKSVSCEAFPLLESLILVNLINLEAICYGQLKAQYFGQLRIIRVERCKMLKNLFSFSIARVYQFQEILVSDCENFTGLLVEKREEDIGEDILEFSQLRSLRLRGLPSFMGLIYSEKKLSSSQPGSIQSIDARSNATSLFDQKVLFPNIEALDLYSIPIEQLWHDQLPILSFGVQNLTSLELRRCHNLKNLFTSSMVKSFVQLKTLVVEDCNKIEEVIIITEGLVEEERMRKMVFPKLDYLILRNLPNLKRFCFGNPIEFPFLRELKIDECPVLNTFHCDSTSVGTIVGNEAGKSSISMENLHMDIPKYLFNEKVLFPNIKELVLWSIPIEQLWHDQLPILSFGVQNLKSLELCRCHNLKNLFTSSMVKSFVQLKRLVVVNCNKIEEVIIITEGLVEKERTRKLVFPELDHLDLIDLPNLKRFCFGNPIEFPFLRELMIVQCPVLNTFHCDSTSVGTIVGNEAAKSSISRENLHIDVPKYLFNEKVALPMLEHLTIIWLKNLEKLWPKQLDEDSFSKLIYFELENCDKLLNVFPLSMLTRLQRLNELIIWGCNLLEEIFESQQEGSSTAIHSLSPELFQSSLVQENITFGFAQLTYLTLGVLPKLKSFFHKVHTTNWPSLKEMIVHGCNNVEIFASEYLSFPKTGGKDQQEIPIQWPLFWINELTFPNLQKLTFGWNDGMKEILHGQRLASDYFCKLKVLRLRWYPQQIAIFPSYLFQLLSLPNLERLEIAQCYFKEMVFQSESVGGEEKPASASMVLSWLTELCLVDLEELMYLWKEENRFQNLRILSVESCPKLKSNLVPSSVFFQNLMTLEVQRCPGIIKLVTHSTAKSLVKLREMRISDCEKLEEIIEGSDGGHDEVKDEISFPQLDLLKLTRLSKLESFCSSGNHTFVFPSLTTVVVQDCQKMKMFSQGGLNTPMLHKVLLQSNEWGDEEHWIWEGSLNSTMQQLFKDRVIFCFIEPMASSDPLDAPWCAVPTTACGWAVYPS
ncbi:hypothetical protein CRYUN_Cryun16bG0034300 [Craigia yunnanensis]